MYIKSVELHEGTVICLCILSLQAVKFNENLCNNGTHYHAGLYSILSKKCMPQLPKQSKHIRADASVGIAYASLHAGPAVQ